MFDLLHAPGLLGWINRSDIEIVQISIMIGFGYDLRDTQDGEMGFIFCGKHPLLVTKTEVTVSDPGPRGPLIFSFCLKQPFS